MGRALKLKLMLLLCLSRVVVVAGAAAADHSTASDASNYNSTACSTPCENGTYEVMACSDSHPKLCKGLSVA